MVLNNLGSLLVGNNDIDEAERMFKRAISALESASGHDPLRTLIPLVGLGSVLTSKGEYAEAEALLKRALVARDKLGLSSHPQYIYNLNGYALLLRRIQRYAEATMVLRRAIGIEDGLLAPDDPKRSHRRNNLAIVCMLDGQLDEAQRIAAEAWSLKTFTSFYDVTSGRILFGRIALCYLLGEDAKFYTSVNCERF